MTGLEVDLDGIGKRFKNHWLYRGISAELRPGAPTAILGPNGSGKSTLLQIISGYLSPSAGSVNYRNAGSAIPRDAIFRHVAICSPHLELHDLLTLEETLLFHHRLRPIPGFTTAKAAAQHMHLENHRAKQMASFSSGMRQRVKLYLAIVNDAPLLLLDEPTSNLDASGTAWYQSLLDGHGLNQRTVVVCSNLADQETHFCTQEIRLPS